MSRTQEGVPGEITTSPDAVQTAAVDALYRAMRLDLVRLASGLIDDVRMAEEIVQDAFVGLYRNWRELADEASAPAYVKRSVINAAYSELRRRAVRRRRFEPPPAASTESAEALALLAQEHRDTVAAVRSLPARQREVVLLRYWQGLSEADIAAALGISTGSVKSAASRGLDTIERKFRRSNQ